MAARRGRGKPKNKLKNNLIPLVLIAVVLVVIVMTTISPSADVRRSRTGTTSQSAAPSITSISPSSGKIGDVISIRGRGFQPGTTTVYFGNGVVTNYLANSTDTSLNIYVPDTVCKPPVGSSCKGITIKPGTYKVYVTDSQGRKSNQLTFTVKR